MKYTSSSNVVTDTLAVLIDDDEVSSELTAAGLSAAGIQVVRRDTVGSALLILPMLEPDIVLTELPEGSERANPVPVLRKACQAPIIVFSAMGKATELESLAPGATAYFSKPFDPQQLAQRLVDLIEQSRRAREEAREVRDQARETRRHHYLRGEAPGPSGRNEPDERSRAIKSSINGRYGLSTREHEVLVLVVAGLSDGEIAQHLGIASNTASKHVMAIREKLGVRSRTEAAVRAFREGLVDASSGQ